MTVVRTIVRDAIAADGGIAALLTGGVYATREISRRSTAAAFDANGELRPCALVRVTTEDADGPDQYAGRASVDVYLYERDSYTAIDQVLPLLRTLLHRQKVGAASAAVFESRWRTDVTDQEDVALGVNLHLTRYDVVRYIG